MASSVPRNVIGATCTSVRSMSAGSRPTVASSISVCPWALDMRRAARFSTEPTAQYARWTKLPTHLHEHTKAT